MKGFQLSVLSVCTLLLLMRLKHLSGHTDNVFSLRKKCKMLCSGHQTELLFMLEK